MGLYDNVKAACKEKGIPITQLEKACGMPQSSIRKWNTNKPNMGRVLRVAEYLGVTLDELVCRRGFHEENQ